MTQLPATPSPALAPTLAQLAELEARGRETLTGFSLRSLAFMAGSLYAALYVLQSDGVRGAEAVDRDAIEDLCGLFQRLEHEQGRAA